MPARKMRIELFDNEGNKYTIGFEGQISRDKALKLIDMVELLGGLSTGNVRSTPQLADGVRVYQTKCDKLFDLIRRNYASVWFTSNETRQAYEEEFKEPISLSTASTYLGRLNSRGLLSKSGSANSIRYRIPSVTSPVADMPKVT